jgi:8-hydroxy-5-deazaflavin:NADPH oxidoreductase
MSNIAILGSGRVASALAKQLAEGGHSASVGIPNPTIPSKNWTGPNIKFATPAEAISNAQIIFNSTPGESSVDFLTPFKELLRKKILVDVSNALRRNDKGMPIGLYYPDSSVAEHLQSALPDTHVVKTLNTMLFTVIANPKVLSTMPMVFMSGDDATAKMEVRKLLQEFGWPNSVIEDLGGVASARGPEGFMNFVPYFLANHGFAPFALTIAR